MNLAASVSSIMTRDPVVVTPEDKLSDVRKLISEHRVHHIPVVQGGRFVGLITTTDLFRMSFGNTYGQDPETVDALLDTYTIRDAMIEDVLTIQAGETIRRAAELLGSDGAYHCLPVLEGETLVGMVTTTDLVRIMLT